METFTIDGFHPLPASRRQAYEFYAPVALADGFPARRTSKGLVAHPIYGTYLIRDYLWAFRKTRDEGFLHAAKRIGKAALDRMEAKGPASVFWYEEDGLAPTRGKHYSGLTQARYLMPLHNLWGATGDPAFRDASMRVFESLRLPVEEGGVMRTHSDGFVVEEFPHDVPALILNGWTTAMMQIFDLAKAEKDNQEVSEFADGNMRALSTLLPLYDIPEIANTRYQLAGFNSFRLRSEKNASLSFLSGQVTIGDKEHRILLKDEVRSPRWESHLRGSPSGSSLLFTLVLSRASEPAPNKLKVSLQSSASDRIALEYADHPYDPFTSGISLSSPSEWRTIATTQIGPGIQNIEIDIAWPSVPIIGYPTNFKKKIAGKNQNVYHWMHVTNLEALAPVGPPEVAEWATKWRTYAERWATMPLYSSGDLNLSQFGALSAKA